MPERKDVYCRCGWAAPQLRFFGLRNGDGAREDAVVALALGRGLIDVHPNRISALENYIRESAPAVRVIEVSIRLDSVGVSGGSSDGHPGVKGNAGGNRNLGLAFAASASGIKSGNLTIGESTIVN